MKKLLLIATGIALGALWNAAGMAAESAPGANETELPQAAKRLYDWALDGYRGIWVQSVDKHWYYAEFLNPCMGAVPDNVSFRFNNATGSLDRFSQVIVRRIHRTREVCAIKSFSPSAGPPAGVLHALPHPG